MVYVYIDQNNRVTGWGSNYAENAVKVDVPEDSELLKNPFVFVYQDGHFIKDTEYQQKLIDEKNAFKNAPTNEAVLSDLIYQLMMKGVV